MRFFLPLCFCRIQGQVQTQPAEARDEQLGLQPEDTVPNVFGQSAAGRVARHPDSTSTVSLDSGGPTEVYCDKVQPYAFILTADKSQ